MDGMHKKHADAMKADLDKMKASLDQMKANVAKISDSNERARWQANVDLWSDMVGHMEHMMKHMDDMGSGEMDHHGKGMHCMGMMDHIVGRPAARSADGKATAISFVPRIQFSLAVSLGWGRMPSSVQTEHSLAVPCQSQRSENRSRRKGNPVQLLHDLGYGFRDAAGVIRVAGISG